MLRLGTLRATTDRSVGKNTFVCKHQNELIPKLQCNHQKKKLLNSDRFCCPKFDLNLQRSQAPIQDFIHGKQTLKSNVSPWGSNSSFCQRTNLYGAILVKIAQFLKCSWGWRTYFASTTGSRACDWNSQLLEQHGLVHWRMREKTLVPADAMCTKAWSTRKRRKRLFLKFRVGLIFCGTSCRFWHGFLHVLFTTVAGALLEWRLTWTWRLGVSTIPNSPGTAWLHVDLLSFVTD